MLVNFQCKFLAVNSNAKMQQMNESKLLFVVINIMPKMSSSHTERWTFLQHAQIWHLLTVMFGEEWYSCTGPRVPSHLTLIESCSSLRKTPPQGPTSESSQASHTLARLYCTVYFPLFPNLPVTTALTVHAHVLIQHTQTRVSTGLWDHPHSRSGLKNTFLLQKKPSVTRPHREQ